MFNNFRSNILDDLEDGDYLVFIDFKKYQDAEILTVSYDSTGNAVFEWLNDWDNTGCFEILAVIPLYSLSIDMEDLSIDATTIYV